MRIRQRLILGFLSVVVIFVLFGGYLLFVWQAINADMSTLDQMFEDTSVHTISELESTLHMVLSLETFRRALHEYMLGHDEAEAEISQSIDDFDHYYSELRAILVDEDAGDGGLQPVAQRAASLSTADKIRTLDDIEASHERVQAHILTFIEFIRNGNIDAALQLKDREIESEINPVFVQLQAFERSVEAHIEELGQRFDTVIHLIEVKIRQMQTVTIAVLGLGILAAFVMGYYTSEAISEPIERLAEAAVAVEAGSYELDSLARVTTRSDELGQFARAFEQMAREVHAREQKLKAQVNALQIKIDHQQSEEQVEEITETDFFKDLQAKARAMRASKEDLSSQ